MVIAYHLIWTNYGYWLPNDPRGSSSTTIRSDVLKELGEVHFGRKRIQPSSSTLRTFFETNRPSLKYPVCEFNDTEIAVLAEAFDNVIQQERYTCYALAIMPDHIHVLIRKHRDQAEDMIIKLQRAGHLALRHKGAFDMKHPIWVDPVGKYF